MTEPAKRGRPRKIDPPKRRANGACTHYEYRGKHIVQGTVPGLGRRKVQADSEEEAWAGFAELRAMSQHLDLDAKSSTVGQVAEGWLRNYERGKAQVSTRTIRAQRVRHHIIEDGLLSSIRVRELQPADVERWLDHKIARGYTKAGKRQHYSRLFIRDIRADLRQIVAWAINRRIVDWNPVDHIDEVNIAESGPKRTLTVDQATHLIRECAGSNRRFATYVLAALLLGARPGEIAGLTWDRIDFDAGTVRIDQAMKRDNGSPLELGDTKNKIHRTVVAPTILLDALEMERKHQEEERHVEWPARWEGLVFRGRLGTPPVANQLRGALRQIVSDAGLEGVADLDPYELRHTCASLLDHLGVPVSQIIDQLGWADDRMFYKHYRHRTDPVSGAAGVAAWETMLG